MVILDSSCFPAMPNVPPTSRLKRYFSVVGRWCAITFVVFAITLATGKYIYENLLPKTYTATAKIEVGASGADNFEAIFDGIESRDVLGPVISDLGLDTVWAKRYSSNKEQLSQADALSHLKRSLEIDAQRGTNVINITVLSEAPREAAQIANAIADRYKAERGIDEVRILERPEAAEYPTRPDKLFCFAVTVAAAALISVIAGCFVEVILLFVRAGDGEHS